MACLPQNKLNMEECMAKWFFPEEVPANGKRLFCFSYAGGGASAYRLWLKDSAISVIPVQLPGRENRMREEPLQSMDDIVEQVAKMLYPYIHMPYALFGHSLGARIAFEIVRHMRKKKWPLPSHLFVSGSRAPEIPEPSPLHNLDEDSFFRELARYEGTPKMLLENKELRKIFLPMLKADFTVDETYIYQEEEALPIPISAFYGSEDREASYEEVLGWKRQTNATFLVHEIPGKHFFVTQEAPRLLNHIKEDLHVQ